MSVAADMHETMMAVSTAYRLNNSGVTIDGVVALDFARYPFIPQIIDERHREVTILKGAQMGFTIACIMRSLELAKTNKYRGVGYFFPTEDEVGDFVQARYNPMMSDNWDLWGSQIKNTNKVSLKKVGNTHLYFRGAGQRGSGAEKGSTSKQKSIPLDDYTADEADEMSPARLDAIDHRLDGSGDPGSLWLSTPTLPEFGVDLRYASSDQRVWMWQCQACNTWQCLELSYPDCVVYPTEGKEAYVVCEGKRCGKPLQRVMGEWVARKTEIQQDHAGYWISQLGSPTRTAQDVVDEELKANKSGRKKEFENQVLARAYAEVDEQITEEMLSINVNPEERKRAADEGPCAMGVDPGKPNWYQVRKRITDVDSIVVHQGRCDDYETLSRVSKAFNVECGVMDKGYDPSAVDRFCEEHDGWYGCLYVEQKSTTPDWNHSEREVKVGRTRTLNDSFNAILDKRVKYYAKDEFWNDHFVPQMKNLKKSEIVDDITGNRKSRWVVTGTKKDDHMRHADNYCTLALERTGIAADVRRARGKARSQSSGGNGHRSAMTL